MVTVAAAPKQGRVCARRLCAETLLSAFLQAHSGPYGRCCASPHFTAKAHTCGGQRTWGGGEVGHTSDRTYPPEPGPVGGWS